MNKARAPEDTLTFIPKHRRSVSPPDCGPWIQAPTVSVEVKTESVPSPLPSKPAPRVSKRQLCFRVVRLTMAGILVAGGVVYVGTIRTTATSDLAYINAEITAFRAPIGGQAHLEALEPGLGISAASPLFRIENSRFGNQDAMSQLNWVKELSERLLAESSEAALQFRQQEEIFEAHERMFAEKVISRLDFLKEQAKLDSARALMTNKEAQATQAKERCRNIEAQVELQKEARVTLPFEGVVWSVPAKDGAQVSQNETIVEVIDPKRTWVEAFFHERHAAKFTAGTQVNIRTLEGGLAWRGTVESVRSGVGRIPYDGAAAVPSGEYRNRRIGVRIRTDSVNPYDASQFFGVGRSVVVTLCDHE